MAGFGVMFFTAFFSYAVLGYMIFGSSVQGYRSIVESIFTLLRIILGDFDFPGMRAAQPALGPFYFFTYVIFIFFILLVRLLHCDQTEIFVQKFQKFNKLSI